MASMGNGEAGIYNMSLKNVLIVVDNIDESIDFYAVWIACDYKDGRKCDNV